MCWKEELNESFNERFLSATFLRTLDIFLNAKCLNESVLSVDKL